MPAPPPVDAFKCQLIYTVGDVNECGQRFFISWGGVTPTSDDCVTLCNSIATAWEDQLAGCAGDWITLSNVIVTDLSSDMGASAETDTSLVGTREGLPVPIQVAVCIAFHSDRRFRGGHPKTFAPFGTATDYAGSSEAEWDGSLVDAVTTGWGNFIAAVLATSGLSTTLAGWIYPSFYSGYNTVGPFPDGKFKYPPKPRAVAAVYGITGFTVNSKYGSQRRRRLATSP
jgi:hypothetical protein